MRAEYDSEADALLITLVEVDRLDRTDVIELPNCTVGIAEGAAASVELLGPRKRLDLLADAAKQHALDHEALQAAAQSALAAPDRVVVLDVLTAA